MCRFRGLVVSNIGGPNVRNLDEHDVAGFTLLEKGTSGCLFFGIWMLKFDGTYVGFKKR